MPNIPSYPPIVFLGVLSLIVGVFFLLAGLKIIKIQLIEISPGLPTLTAGIIFMIVGVAVLWSDIVSIFQADSAATWTDEFDGNLATEWTWINEDSINWNLTDSPGLLRILTQGQSLYQKDVTKNLLLRDASYSNFEISTRLVFEPTTNFHQAGILIYENDDNFVMLNRGYCDIVPNCVNNGIYMDEETSGTPGLTIERVAINTRIVYLKLSKSGTKYTSLYSTDGENWIELGSINKVMSPGKVGLFANNSNDDPNVPKLPADFDFFTIEEI